MAPDGSIQTSTCLSRRFIRHKISALVTERLHQYYYYPALVELGTIGLRRFRENFGLLFTNVLFRFNEIDLNSTKRLNRYTPLALQLQPVNETVTMHLF